MIEVDNGSTDIIQILKIIHPRANERVWKGFTGPEDSSYYSNYRFFAVKGNLHGGQYKVTDVQKFDFPANDKYRRKWVPNNNFRGVSNQPKLRTVSSPRVTIVQSIYHIPLSI